MPSSLDNMMRDSPFLQALAEMKVAPGVDAHSIIAVLYESEDPSLAHDGVVTVRSQRREGVESEFIPLGSLDPASSNHDRRGAAHPSLRAPKTRCLRAGRGWSAARSLATIGPGAAGARASKSAHRARAALPVSVGPSPGAGSMSHARLRRSPAPTSARSHTMMRTDPRPDAASMRSS